MDRKKIREMVVDLLEKAMDLDPAIITDNASLQGDLGIESIDLLDVQFRIERMFNIQFDRDELFPDDIFTDKDTCVKNGMVTEQGRIELMSAIPHADWASIKDPLPAKEIKNIFTVCTLVNFIESKLSSPVV